MDECEDPPDLKTQLGEWSNSEFSLTKQSDDHKGEDSDSDDKWTLPADPEMVKICSEPPATSVNSSVMQRSLCPWHWRLNHDDTREPKLISEAVCLCRKSRGTSGSYCMPIQREMPILKRVACNPVTKRYEYVKAVKMVTVGCHSVLPRTQRALPLSRYYSQTQSVEI
ncbi:interleukin-17 domain-containing protein [Ditylenchus destructor]|nr:interleukin-17 domain-containing protein [Ditylenchus destructor]